MRHRRPSLPRRLVSMGLAFAIGLHGAAADAASCLRGINLAGAEFGRENVYGKDYIYPSKDTITHFAKRGFTVVRLPFRWERLQPALGKPFDAEEFSRLKETVALIKATGMKVVLDPHNYARYRNEPIGSAPVPDAAFADLWRRLSAPFANDAAVIFGLMNEPHDIDTQGWLRSVNTAIAAIRKTRAHNLVFVPGTGWGAAHNWRTIQLGGNVSDVMLGVKDPASNYAYEVHQYFDTDFSGQKGTCERGADAVAIMADLSTWLRTHGKRGYLGEFGVPAGAECNGHLAAMVREIETNDDVWVGWSYWAAGDWWPKDEALNIQPVNGIDKPQLSALTPFLQEGPQSGKDCLPVKH